MTWNAGAVQWNGLRLEPRLSWRDAGGIHEAGLSAAVATGTRLDVQLGPWCLHLDLTQREGWLLVDGVVEHQDHGATLEDLCWIVSGGDLAAEDLRCWGLPYTTWGKQVAGPAATVAAPWWRSVWHRPLADGVAVGWHMPADWLHRVERRG